MNRFDNVRTYEDMERTMSMGHGGKKVMGWANQNPPTCPKSPREDGRHLVTVLSNVQSIEHFKCDYCDEEWYD